jgi:CBS domain containing-hemolysin-like protein
LAGEPESRPLVTEDELRYMVDVGAEEGEIKKKEREMITNIMEFDLIDVREVMTPRPDVYSVDGTRVLKEAMPELMKKNFSRYPVYEKNPDNIIGVVLMKDLNEAMNKKKSSQKIKKFTKKVLIVLETKHIDKLLPEFQKKKKHMAVVVDEHGNMAGIITIEDLLEQIVGEIYDETDKVEREIVKIKPKLFKVKGHANIDDVNKELKLGIKVKDEYDTISGFVLDKLGRIPKKGEILKYKKAEIKVDRVEGNRITELKIRKK